MPAAKLTTVVVLGLGLFLATLLILGGGLIPVARAATITVTTGVDEILADGRCSLREAILSANRSLSTPDCFDGSPGPDVINLGAITHTITLTGTGDDQGLTGDLDITEALTITGQGAGQTIIDATGVDRVFDILAGVPDVIISGVTIVKGFNTNDGGAIRSRATNLTLNNTVLDSNSVGVTGGALYIAAGTATMRGSQSRISNNSAARGGGINASNGRFILSNGQISGNSASNKGGGVYVERSAAEFIQNGGVIINNRASSNEGGGVLVESGKATLNGGQIISNTAGTDGGGLYIFTGSAVFNGGQIVSNTANNNGGGVLVADSPALFTSAGAGTIATNRAANDGGGIYVKGTATLSGGQIRQNSAAGSNGGGGVFVDSSGQATLNNIQILSNTASVGSGGGVWNRGVISLTAGAIRGNQAPNLHGGGIFNDLFGVSIIDIDSSDISNNVANNGGGIFNEQQLSLNNSQVDNNRSLQIGSFGGGGIYNVGSSAAITITGGSVSTNSSAHNGGGLYNEFGRATLFNVTLQNNDAPANGGGMYVNFGGQMTVSGGQIISNVANTDGGGLYLADGTVDLVGLLVGNVAGNNGGGLYANKGSAMLTAALLLDNQATDGGAIYQDGSGAFVTIGASCLVNNSGASVRNVITGALSAVGNWWGAADGPSGTGPGRGDSVGIRVDFSGFLAAPILNCPTYPPAKAGSGVLYKVFPNLGTQNSRDVGLADIDLDGDLDAIDANGSPNQIWLNDGTGMFTLGSFLGDDDSQAIALGDLDGNHAPDAVIVNTSPDQSTVWFNDGYGVFNPQPLGPSDGRDVAIGSLNPLTDTHADLIIINGSSQPHQVWLNQGGGMFSTGSSLPASNAQAVAVADFDGDTVEDIVLANGAGENSQVWYNDGSGTFTISATLGISNSQAVAVGDIDGQNGIDVILGNGSGQLDQVWLNNGSGAFTPHQSFGPTDTRSLFLGNLDEDDHLDLVIGAGNGSQVWLNDGNGTFTLDQTLAQADSQAVIVGDLDGDGDFDLFVANNGGNQVFLNQNDQTESAITGTTFILHFGQGLTLTLEIPATVLEATTVFSYVPTSTLSLAPQPLDAYSFANRAFSLDAFQNGAHIPDPFSGIVTMTVYYEPELVSDTGRLSLYFLDETMNRWEDVATSCSPRSNYARFLHHFKIEMCHLSEFALLEQLVINQNVYLPLLLKEGS